MGVGWSHRKRARAVVRQVSTNFNLALSSYFGTHTPNAEAARDTHAEYVAVLREQGVEVDVLPGLDDYPDCTFVEDAAIVVGDVVVIPFMGHTSSCLLYTSAAADEG